MRGLKKTHPSKNKSYEHLWSLARSLSFTSALVTSLSNLQSFLTGSLFINPTALCHQGPLLLNLVSYALTSHLQLRTPPTDVHLVLPACTPRQTLGRAKRMSLPQTLLIAWSKKRLNKTYRQKKRNSQTSENK